MHAHSQLIQSLASFAEALAHCDDSIHFTSPHRHILEYSLADYEIIPEGDRTLHDKVKLGGSIYLLDKPRRNNKAIDLLGMASAAGMELINTALKRTKTPWLEALSVGAQWDLTAAVVEWEFTGTLGTMFDQERALTGRAPLRSEGQRGRELAEAALAGAMARSAQMRTKWAAVGPLLSPCDGVSAD